MKNYTYTTLVAALCFIGAHIAFAQQNPTVIQYDYQTGQLTQNPASTKSYFLTKHLSQPVIEVVNLPAGHKSEVSEEQRDLVPQTAQAAAMAPAAASQAQRHIMKEAKGDEINYSITIKDASNNVERTIPVFVKAYGRWKIDMSTGVIFNMNLTDEKYFYEATGDDAFVLKKDNNEPKLTPTLAVLSHFYRSSKGNVNWGGVFGLGINDEGKTGWYFGGGILIGRDQRIGLSGGIAWRTVDKLKSKYKTLYNDGSPVTEADQIDTDDLVEGTYKQGWFIAFTYNLTSKSEKK